MEGEDNHNICKTLFVIIWEVSLYAVKWLQSSISAPKIMHIKNCPLRVWFCKLFEMSSESLMLHLSSATIRQTDQVAICWPVSGYGHFSTKLVIYIKQVCLVTGMCIRIPNIWKRMKIKDPPLNHGRASLLAQTVKSPLTMQKTQVPSLSWEDSLEKGMATHSSILAWRIPWTKEPGGLQSMGSQRVG